MLITLKRLKKKIILENTRENKRFSLFLYKYAK